MRFFWFRNLNDCSTIKLYCFLRSSLFSHIFSIQRNYLSRCLHKLYLRNYCLILNSFKTEEKEWSKQLKHNWNHKQRNINEVCQFPFGECQAHSGNEKRHLCTNFLCCNYDPHDKGWNDKETFSCPSFVSSKLRSIYARVKSNYYFSVIIALELLFLLSISSLKHILHEKSRVGSSTCKKLREKLQSEKEFFHHETDDELK